MPFYKSLLQGYQVSLDNKGRYVQGIARLLGGIPEIITLSDEAMVSLLSNAQLRKGTAFTYKQHQQLANPNEHILRFQEQMMTLAAKGVFLRGYRLQCATCDLDSWYPLANAGEFITCQGCRTDFQMPLELAFAYRPNQLLTQGLKNGALSILLTLRLLQNRDEIRHWQAGVLVHKDGKTTDIDLLVQTHEGYLLIECKDNIKMDEASLAKLQVQLEKGRTLAKAVGAEFIFATLYDGDFPQVLTAYLAAHLDIQVMRLVGD